MAPVLTGKSTLSDQKTVRQDLEQRMLFTGPDGIGDYRTRMNDFPRYIGVGPLSPESTSDLNYLYRAAPSTPPPLSKGCCVGGVGWGVHYSGALNSRNLLSNKQIKLAEFRSALEDRITHRYQNPWHAPPQFLDRQPEGTRGRLAWTDTAYDSYSQSNIKQVLLNKKKQITQRKAAEGSEVSSIYFPELVRTNTGR